MALDLGKTENVHIVKHALLTHKLSLLRDKNTPYFEFRQVAHEISLLLAFAATQNFNLDKVTIQTPLEKMTAHEMTARQPIIVPILRAGLGMLDAFLSILPHAKIGYIGMCRNEKTLQSESYYYSMPEDADTRPVIIVDPMLATGGSAAAAINKLKEHGMTDISLVSIIAAPEGIQHLHNEHPDVKLTVGTVDRELDAHAYILPGLGDAGDRLNGT